jgi:hypothetical protein
MNVETTMRYLYGGCYILACAIHDQTGWEIVSTWVESDDKNHPAGEEHAMTLTAGSSSRSAALFTRRARHGSGGM